MYWKAQDASNVTDRVRFPAGVPKMKKDKLTIWAEPKEIDLVISIVNKIFRMNKDWIGITFNGTSLMVPKGYFKDARMKRKHAHKLSF